MSALVPPEKLARWAARFRSGRLTGPVGVVAWDGSPPERAALEAWFRDDGPCRAELAAGAPIVIKLISGVSLSLPRGSVLRLVAPLGPDGRLVAPAVAEATSWSWCIAGVTVPGFASLALHPDGRLELGPGRTRAVAASVLGLALRRTRSWPSVARILVTSA